MITRFTRPSVIQDWLRDNYPSNPEYITKSPMDGYRKFLTDNGATGETLYDMEMSYLAAQGVTSAGGNTSADMWGTYMNNLSIEVNKPSLRHRLATFFRSLLPGGDLLPHATHLWQAKNYTGSGDWLDEKATSHFQFGSISGADTNDPQWLPHSTSQNPFGAGINYVKFPAIAGNYISTPDAAALDITGDLTLVAWVSLLDWTPASINRIIGKFNATANTRSYLLSVGTSGELRYISSVLGSDATIDVQSRTVSGGGSLVPVSFADATAGYIAVYHDVDNGAAGNDVVFLTSPTGAAGTWTQLGVTQTTAGTHTRYSGSAALEIGTISAGATALGDGRYARAQVWSGIRDLNAGTGGTLVADFNPESGAISSDHTALTGTGDGLTWTFNRTTTGRKLAVVDEDKFLLGTDDYFTTADVATMNFGTGAYTIIAVVRDHTPNASATGTPYFNKRDGTAPWLGWSIQTVHATTGVPRFANDAGASQDLADGAAPTPGTRYVITGVRDTTNMTTYQNTTAGTPVTDNGYNADNASAETRVGRFGTGTVSYKDFEAIAFVVFKGRALTSTEVAQVVSELA